MIVHRSTAENRSNVYPLVPQALAEPRVAVLLNANAKCVDAKVRRMLAQVVPENDLFLTSSLEEARSVATTVIERRYSVVFTGGGDGSFVGFVNAIFDALEVKRQASPFSRWKAPRFGVLKLGTGNAIAYACGASSRKSDGLLGDVLRARAGETPSVQRLDLIVAEGRRTPFAGIGVDASILHDYNETRRAFSGSPFAKALAGGGGYALAIATRSIPTYVMNRRPNIEVVSRGAAYRLDADGQPVGHAIGDGATLYRGPAQMAAASTIPCYGYNLKLFPFAGRRRGMMHLRLANVSVRQILPNLYPFWTGKWFGEGIHDFLAEDVEVRLDRKMPFQVGGDAEGCRDFVRFTVAKDPVETLDFRQEARA